MARIIYGAIITDIAGSIGGITFQKNGSGTIARLKPRKNQTNTQRQRDQQPRLKEVQRNWNLLSLVNKVLWNDFAAINNKIGLDGQEKKLTGYQWFLTINENRLLINEDILLIPPTYEIVNPVSSALFNWNQDVLFLQTNVTVNLTLFQPIGYCSFVVNSASKFDFNKTRLLSQTLTGNQNVILQRIDLTDNFWNDYFKSTFPPQLGNNDFYLVGYVRIISRLSGISSLAYTAISKFVWDGAKYVIE